MCQECAIPPCAVKTLSLKIIHESDFSDQAYNSAYVSDVQSLIAKSTLQLFYLLGFLTQDRNDW